MFDISKEIVVATWGIGKSYRNRVKHNIQKSINTGYDKILPYIILTDHPEDFNEFRLKNNKILDVININDERKLHSNWSFDLEYIPDTLDEIEYSILYREKNNKEHKKFSYGLNRFSLPTIAKLGYTKFILCDSDVDIRYDLIVDGTISENIFWEQFNTSINTMKGVDLEHFNMSDNSTWSKANIILANLLKYNIFQNHPYLKKPNFLGLNYTQTEGPFRYYNLIDKYKVNKVFEIWDECIKFILSDFQFRQQISPGVYMYIDNLAFSITNELLDIGFLNFDKAFFKVNVYKSDRFFFPMGGNETINGSEISLQPANTLEEFLIKNKELIEYYKSINNWPD
jgi:hypothetical protein